MHDCLVVVAVVLAAAAADDVVVVIVVTAFVSWLVNVPATRIAYYREGSTGKIVR